MAEESDLEKTEAPTSRRIEQAREEGQVPHSRELGTFLVLIVSAATVWFLGGWFSLRLAEVFRKGLVWDRRLVDEPEAALTRFSSLSWDAVVAFWPLILALVLIYLSIHEKQLINLHLLRWRLSHLKLRKGSAPDELIH